MQIRVQEVKALIDEMFEGKGAQLLSRLGFKSQINLDLDRLIISGHSFGGMTAI
jgi:predicted dienelactone hydrolase